MAAIHSLFFSISVAVFSGKLVLLLLQISDTNILPKYVYRAFDF